MSCRIFKCDLEQSVHLASALQYLAKWPASPHRKHAPTLISAFFFAAASMAANAEHASSACAPLHAAHFNGPVSPEVVAAPAVASTFCAPFLTGSESAPVAATFAWGTFFPVPDVLDKRFKLFSVTDGGKHIT